MTWVEPAALIILCLIVYYCLVLLQLSLTITRGVKRFGNRPLTGSNVKHGLLIAEDRVGVDHDESPSKSFYSRLIK